MVRGKQVAHYEIQKGIKIPVAVKDRDKYSLKKMEVGDSFPFPAHDYMRVANAVYKHSRRHRRRFAVRRATEPDGGGRCWRVE